MTFKLPPPTGYPMSIDTVGVCLAEGYEISMFCFECGRKGIRLNLVQIAKKHGMDYNSLEPSLKKVVSCSECKEAGRPRKNIGFILKPPEKHRSKWPRGR